MRRAALLAELVRTGLGGVAYLLLARSLPLDVMGTFAVVSALVAIGAPLFLAGAPLRLTRAAACDSQRTDHGSLILSSLLYGTAISVTLGVVLVSTGALTGGPLDAVLLVAAESSITLGAILFHALGAGASRGGLVIAAACLGGGPRVVGATWTTTLGDGSARAYAVAVLLVGAVLIGVCFFMLRRGSRTRLLRPAAVYRHGAELGYMASTLCSRVNDDLDKLVLARMSTPESVALYSVPYRLTFYALIPGRAILTARMASWYRDGATLTDRRFAQPLLGAVTASLLSAAVVWVVWDGLTTSVLRPEYGAGKVLIPLFAVAIVLRVVHYFAGELLFTQQRARSRLWAQLCGTGAGALALVTLVPVWGLVGAAAATAVGDGVIAVLTVAALVRAARRDATRRQDVRPQPDAREVAA